MGSDMFKYSDKDVHLMCDMTYRDENEGVI